MANPLFGLLNNNSLFGNISNLINQFNEFKNTFSGNPQQQVQNLLNSGQMSQQQFANIYKLAQQFQSLLGQFTQPLRKVL